MDEFNNLLEEFENTPQENTPAPLKTKAGKKLTNTALVNEIISGILGVITNTSTDVLAEMMMPQLLKDIRQQVGVIPQVIEVHTPTQINRVVGETHEQFEKVLKMVNLDIPVYLTGKAGTGKNVICKQVAEALGLDFYFTNAVTQEYKLTGFIDAHGVYQPTEFYKAFKNGGLFFLDEMDASVPETLVILNAAIANRYFDFPNGKIEAHPDFRVIAAGNTLGTGADINYTGRYSLDKASLDRFAIIKIDYSPKIEFAVSGENQELVNFAHAFRKATDKAGVECLCGYRAIDRIHKLESVFDDLGDVISMAVTKGMDNDTMNVVKQRITEYPGMLENKYTQAFMNMKGE